MVLHTTTLHLTMNIPLVDLKAQYRTIAAEIDAAIAAVIADTAFIGAPPAQPAPPNSR